MNSYVIVKIILKLFNYSLGIYYIMITDVTTTILFKYLYKHRL